MSDRDQARIAEVRAALDRVTDPELDESVVELGFVTDLAIDTEDRVDVGFRLPTYWCAANFSYLMASDMRDAVAGLPWVRSVRVRLDEHMYGETINNGVAEQKDFRTAFGDDAAENLEQIRLHFGLKSFERRQETLVRHLLAGGMEAAMIVVLTIPELECLSLDAEGDDHRRRYLARRPLVGALPLAFVTRDGERIMKETLSTYLRHIGRVALNAEFNSALCRGLLAARYRDAPPPALPANPGLADFMRQYQP